MRTFMRIICFGVFAFIAIFSLKLYRSDKPFGLIMNTSSDEPFNYDCPIPESIPDTLATGEKIYWDCGWYASFKNDHVRIKWVDGDRTKGMRFIYRIKSR